MFSDKRYYKIVYHLKNKWYIYALKKNLYLVTSPSQEINENLVVDDHYWKILHTQMKEQFGKKRYIWWTKALELNMWNHEVPEDVLIITPDKQAIDTLILDQSIQYKKYSNKGKNLFTSFYKLTKKVKFGRQSYAYACLELALLETLYSVDEVRDAYQIELVKKVLKKIKQLDLEIMTGIMQSGKHHTSINRLYQLAKKIKPKLADQLYTCIKKSSFVLSL